MLLAHPMLHARDTWCHSMSDRQAGTRFSGARHKRGPALGLGPATYIKSRGHGAVANQAVAVVTAINVEDCRAVLGLSLEPT